MNITILIVKYFYNKFIWDIINVANVQINLVNLEKFNTQNHNYLEWRKSTIILIIDYIPAINFFNTDYYFFYESSQT